MTEYTVQYFIDKFTAIPEELWFEEEFTNPANPEQHCAYGHCGCNPESQENMEANSLDRLFRDHDLNVALVNDGMSALFQQPTPKARILAALETFK